MNKKFHVNNSIFHVQKTNEDNVISDVILRQARKTGKLNLSNHHLVEWPEEVLKLGVMHSDTDEIDMDGKTGDSFKWWELEPLKYLDMSSNSLKNIPPAIKELDSLMTIMLHQNLVEVLPQEFSYLRNLVKLDLAHNKISEFPPYLSKLKELRTLNLSNNLFKVFPETLYDLVMLNKLDLSKNMMEEMKPGIGFLTRLTHLNLSHNKLTSIPSDLTNCRALTDLNLSNNEITSEGLPELVDMNVEIIHLHYNQITRLPKLRGCSNLKEIHLGFNNIEEVTVEELSTLSHLQIIILRNNHLKKLPQELSCLQNLIRLDLSYNDLTELPATLSLLPHLENLLVEGNSLRTIRRDILQGGTFRLLSHLKQLLTNEEIEKSSGDDFPCISEKKFPDRYAMKSSRAVSLSSKELCNIPNTVFEEAASVPCNIVDISKNKLQKVPEGVWMLSRSLNDLNLSQNQLKEIPVEIGNCLNLRYLNVSNNMITTLPTELAQCHRVRELNISFNSLLQADDVHAENERNVANRYRIDAISKPRIKEIPLCVYGLFAIEILSMTDNKISCLDAEKFLALKYLTHLDVSNNDIVNVPPLMGKMTQLRTFGLDGNGLRALRPATLAKGTEAVLSWLRDKIV